LRIALLTFEYPSEMPDSGGLATYVHRMARYLQEYGHEPEVFVTGTQHSDSIRYEGVLVHRVGWARQPRVWRLLDRASQKLVPIKSWNGLTGLLSRAYYMARALEQRHAAAPFQLIQSADYMATGLFIQRKPGRTHVVRCSSAAELYARADKTSSNFDSVRGFFERLAVKRADVSYAPSRYLADFFHKNYRMNLRVLRPPVHLNPCDEEKVNLPFPLPERFFIHFGLLGERKGTSLLAQALPIAWKTAPDLTMVWCGKIPDQSQLSYWQSLWGDRSSQILIKGPLQRKLLLSVLQKADAAILPSQVDNLPNSVIESLSLGIPVLGSRGASIDELVEEGQTGHLVGLGDIHGLAAALSDMWLRKSQVSKGFKWDSSVSREMNPKQAVENLIKLAYDDQIRIQT
jgi:glycosyltransferase involved in cell wall biosynthesis